ncbi:MAG: hypothetical protein K6A72_02025 [Lachnospiraceae bacterium]|nr:hypothetical protein [Lachnospiraceae bacterium]
MRNNRKKLKKWKYGFIVFAALIYLTACSTPECDYKDASTFEVALDNGDDTVGKIVSFSAEEVTEVEDFGYDLHAGTHLNFVSDAEPDIKSGDKITVRIESVAGVDDYYIIRYKLLGSESNTK